MRGRSLARELTSSQWSTVLLGLAELALRRPGWAPMIDEIADALGGRIQLEAFKRSSADIVAPLGPRFAGGST